MFKARVFVIVLPITLIVIKQYLSRSYSRPEMSLSQYWGEGEPPDDYDIPSKLQLVRPFFDDSVISNVSKLLTTKNIAVSPLEGVNFEYGFNSQYLMEIVTYWKDDYLQRWREREIYIWQFPHYTTYIQGLRLHYVHLKVYDEIKMSKQVLPILLLHGWPSSIQEFQKLIPKLYEGDNNSNFVFEIVVPSLPGFGWSQGSNKPGFGPAQIAVVLRNLMHHIGYGKFYIHGNELGSVIGSHMATLFPESVLGYHSSMCVLYTPLSTAKRIIAGLTPSLFSDKQNRDFFVTTSKALYTLLEETGYFHLHFTKPDTIANVLTNNPIGLAAYILEKFSTWANDTYKNLPDGGLEQSYNRDILLDNVMIYYLTNSIYTSVYLYSELMSRDHLNLGLDQLPTAVPTGCARFKGGPAHHYTLDFQLRDKYSNLIHSTYYPEGGQFPALLQPDLLYRDIIEFVKKGEKYET